MQTVLDGSARENRRTQPRIPFLKSYNQQQAFAWRGIADGKDARHAPPIFFTWTWLAFRVRMPSSDIFNAAKRSFAPFIIGAINPLDATQKFHPRVF